MDKDVKAYFDGVPLKWKNHVQTLHKAVIDCFPEATVDLRYKMPTYSHGEGWVAIASQKNYVSLYTCAVEHMEDFKAMHPDYKTGRGCINFRQRDEIPVDAVKEVIRGAIEHPKGHQP